MARKAHTFALTLAALACGSVAHAHDPEEFKTEPPPEVAAVRVDEQLGAKIPLDLRFRDQAGRDVALADLVRGDVPVVLTFNYTSCPMLCSMMLDGLVDALPGVYPLAAGEHFRIVTIVIDPTEPTERAAETRTKYLTKLEKRRADLRHAAQEGGWTFLTGDERSIRALADSVGVRYVKSKLEKGEIGHPAVLVFLSPSGTVTRYVHGTFFEPDDISASIARAGISEPSGAVGFVQRCFHYDPAAHSYARTGFNVMKFTAAVFATMLIGAVVLAHLLRRSRK